MRSLGSYGSELIVENFRERFFHICTIATYIRTYRSFRCMPPMSSFCEGILGFTGVWGRDHTITTLDAHPMAPRMDVATIGRSLSTWRFSLSLLSEVPTQFHLCHKRSSSTQRSAATQAVSTEETITTHGTITGLVDTGTSLSCEVKQFSSSVVF